jgi:hypothetical protein
VSAPGPVRVCACGVGETLVFLLHAHVHFSNVEDLKHFMLECPVYDDLLLVRLSP